MQTKRREVRGRRAVDRIVHQRQTRMSQVHPNLIGASGVRNRFQKRAAVARPLAFKRSAGGLGVGQLRTDGAHRTFDFPDRGVHFELRFFRNPFHQRPVFLAHPVTGKFLHEHRRRRAGFGKDHEAGGQRIEALHRARHFIRVRLLQKLGHAVFEIAAAGMNRQGRAFVENPHMIVFQQDVQSAVGRRFLAAPHIGDDEIMLPQQGPRRHAFAVDRDAAGGNALHPLFFTEIWKARGKIFFNTITKIFSGKKGLVNLLGWGRRK